MFLTTGDISDEVRESIQEYVRDFREKNNLRMQIRFIPFGRGELDQLIMDYNYGFIPQLGKKKIRFRKYFYDTGEIKSLVGIAKIDEILEWFEGEWELEEALNKNVRGFLGDKKPNKEIRKSYEKKPDKFFYKHNGIVVFADKFTCKENRDGSCEVILSNPQVVNGGQTLKSIYKVYENGRRTEAEVLLRIYEIPYEDSSKFEDGLDIIYALNLQNPIKESDLHSNDKEQVAIERLMKNFDYSYIRKREEGSKESDRQITMTRLAQVYFALERPYEVVRGEVENLFREKYKKIFPWEKIKLSLNGEGIDHIVIDYITAWRIYRIVKNKAKPKKGREKEIHKYVWPYMLYDVYHKLKKFKSNFETSESWIEYIHEYRFESKIEKYSRKIGKILYKMYQKSEAEPKEFFRRKDTFEKFKKETSKKKIEREFYNLKLVFPA